MISLEESLARLKEIQDQAQEKLAQMPRRVYSEAEIAEFRNIPLLFDPQSVAEMEQAINEAFPMNYLVTEDE
jgi:hypothetical protein